MEGCGSRRWRDVVVGKEGKGRGSIWEGREKGRDRTLVL